MDKQRVDNLTTQLAKKFDEAINSNNKAHLEAFIFYLNKDNNIEYVSNENKLPSKAKKVMLYDFTKLTSFDEAFGSRFYFLSYNHWISAFKDFIFYALKKHENKE